MLLILVLLVECKSGDLSDIHNYRAISLPTAMSKLLNAKGIYCGHKNHFFGSNCNKPEPIRTKF